MKNTNKIVIPIFLIVISLFTACNSDQDSINADNNIAEIENLEFDLVFASRGDGDFDDKDGYLEDPALYFNENETCLLISQRSSSVSLDFHEGNPNCYKYYWNGNYDANWESGFNFVSDNPLNWGNIIDNGQYSNGYALGALFYPENYIEEVASDQSRGDEFVKNDIMGAWHRTSNVRSRITFRLYHLMSRLKINLYLPVFDSDKNNSGVDPDNVEASMVSMRTDYSIEWGDRTTEWPPVARPSTTTTGNIQNILMFPTESGLEIEDFSIKEFTGMDGDTDNVRLYSFEALFPEQSVNGDFLRFTVTQNNGEKTTNYLFNSAYITQNANQFKFAAGAITNLELYLSRTDNNVVMLKANVLNWNEAEASFTITPR